MNYSGNMPDWHQYNSTQPIGSEVPPVSQNANHSPIFGSNISPRRLNGPTFSPEGLNKPQNDANFNTRNFQQSPNALSGPNVPPDNSPMGSAVQISGCHGPYRVLSPRNTMIESTITCLDSRNVPSSSLNEAIGQRNHQISMNRPAAHLNCSTTNGSMGPMGQRSTSTSLQAPIQTSSMQGPGSYVPCKLACCHPDTNISYQSWEKFGPYPPNMPYRDTGYPVDNRRFGNEFENREQLGAGAYKIDARRNFPDYKYRKDTIIPRPYAPPPGVIQNYPIQNYNFPADYQKYPAYPLKEYPRESSIANPQNPSILKYQEQSVIVQQKYFTKQIQYQNGVIPTSIGPTSIGSNVISRAQNPYFNSQLARDFPQSYSDSTTLGNRGMQTTNSIHTTYPKYQMYQQKIAMQRFSMENHLRELTRIPGYQSHPKYQESVLRYRELLRLQQTVDYQSTVRDQPNVVTSQVNDEIPPINLQFDQNGVLINSSFTPPAYSNLQSPISSQNSKNVQRVSGTEVGPLNLQYSEQFKTQASIDNRVQGQDSSPLSQAEPPLKNDQHYSVEKDQLRVQKYESESLNVPNTSDGKTPSMHQRNSRDFADKPELDVRQFLANWDESEDEDGGNANLPDVVLSNSTSSAVPEFENTNTVAENLEEAENCSKTEDCRGRDDCGIFENNQNETKPSNSTDHQCELPPVGERTKSIGLESNISDSEKKPIRIGTVIQPTDAECDNEISLHIMDDLANNHGSVKLLHRETESLNNNKCQEHSDTIKGDVIVKRESIEEETITCLKEHIEAYNHGANMELRSNIKGIIENNDDSRSSYGKRSSENTEHHFDSNDDLSESCDSDSMDSHSISSYIKSPKTIKGTEIHVDAQELSAIPVPPKSNSDTVDNTNIQKQNSFASEESHNPDDISLPDLPTSECTPISTALNTPIHSDSDESSEPVIDLTTPANPIEIIQNSPMLSFTHSPIKMEPYEHLDENDLTDKLSHDTLDFKFPASNSCDNDYDKLTDVSSHGTEQYNISQNEEDTFDSDCMEVSSEKGDQIIKVHTHDTETKITVRDDITDQNRFAFHRGNASPTNNANIIVNADHQPWPPINVGEHKHRISTDIEHRDVKNDVHKLESSSQTKDRLYVISEVTEDRLIDDIAHIPSAKNSHNKSRWQTKSEMENVESMSTNNQTALNLVKIDSKIASDSFKMTDETVNAEVVPKVSECCVSSCNEDMENPNRSECNSSMESEMVFTATNRTVGYTSSSDEDKMYAENIKQQTNFCGSLNIPLIPGEEFEEPKMPVLPMEGNCLTKIIKNTSPITDLDVLGSDDEKLDKMDEIWSEVGSVETVDKVTDVNINTYTGCSEGSDREKNLLPRNKLRVVPKYDWKCLKNSVKPKNPNKFLANPYNESPEVELKTAVGKHSHVDKSSSLETAQKEVQPITEDFQSTVISAKDNTTAALQEKHNSIKITTVSRVASNNSFRADSKQSHDTCLDNNATEILKCKEKANHINDIATKLLENARLFDPGLRKMEVRRRESSCGDDSRDGSKKRIKLLKEFRKVKNRMNVDRSGIQSTKAIGTVENDPIPSIEVTKQCENMYAETIKINNEVMENQNTSTSTVENPPPNFDSLTSNSLDTVDQGVRKVDLNAEENTSHMVSTDIPMLDKKLNNGGETPENEHTPPTKNYSIVNREDSITVKDSTSIHDHNRINTKAVRLIEKDIDKCAINLSKSVNNFALVQTLDEATQVMNDDHHSYSSEQMEIEEPTAIKSKTNEETTCIKATDDCPILSHSSCLEDSGLCTEVEEEDGQALEIYHNEIESFAVDYRESSPASTCMNSAEECISKEDTKEKTNHELMRTTDHKEPEDLLDDPEKVQDKTTSYLHPEKVASSIICETDAVQMNTIVSKQNGHSESNVLIDVEDGEDPKPDAETVDSEMTHKADIVGNDVGTTSTGKIKEESMKLVDIFYESEEHLLSNGSAKEEISVKSLDVAPQKMSNEKKIEITSLPCQERNTDQLSGTNQLIGLEPVSHDDCLTQFQKNLSDLDTTTNIHTESKTIHNVSEISETSPILDDFLIERQSEKCRETGSLQKTNSAMVSGVGKSSNAVDAALEAFGLENSFNCDFSNFDVAPNFSGAANTDQSNNWKYSKAYARFEDCERYKNPDNFTNPILTSLDTLDNLHTVPVYTTKDGKITYSPNPRFTYRALIMEAREREGYPALRESYFGSSRTEESSNHSKNQASFRKRKNTDTYSYSRSHGKMNYSDYYEPKEHGESSMKHSAEPWNKSHLSRNKYSLQSKDRKSHHVPSYNDSAEKKYTTEKIPLEKASTKYKNQEGSEVFDKFNKRKNGTSVSFKLNNKRQYKQSMEQSASDPVRSGSEQNLKCDEDSSEIIASRPDTNKLTNHKKMNNFNKIISTEKYVNKLKDGNRSEDFQHTEKITSDETKHATESSANISQREAKLGISSDVLFVANKSPKSRIESSESLFRETENTPSNAQNLRQVSSHHAKIPSTIRFGLFSSEWEDSCEEIAVQQSTSYAIKTPTESRFEEIEEVCHKKTKENQLYDGIDDVHQSKTLDINEKIFNDTDISGDKSAATLNSVQSSIGHEKVEDSVCIQKELNIDRNESTVDDAENEDESNSIPIKLIQSGKDTDEQQMPQITEIQNQQEPAASSNEKVEYTQKKSTLEEPLYCVNGLNRTEICTSEEKSVDDEELAADKIPVDKQIESKNFDKIDEVQNNFAGQNSHAQILHSSEDLCNTWEVDQIERKRLPIEYYKIDQDRKDGASLKSRQQSSDNTLFHRMIPEYENTSKPQSQLENYIAYSPSDESPEAMKAIPKLVIKKTDNLNCINVRLGPSSATPHDVFAGKVADKEEHGSKVLVHPKIPKILIRNAKSRPSTPSIEEITEKESFSATTKEDGKVPKVKIRFEEKRPRSPAVSSNENISKTDITDIKIPKMKIKLEDRLPKVIIENINVKSCGSNEEVQKTIPKMKIKKCGGMLRQIVDTQILPVSIPRMVICAELENDKEITPNSLTETEVCKSDRNSFSVTPTSIEGDQSAGKDAVFKKIPKLKIKRQSAGCSGEMNRKRHSVSPIQSEIRRLKKSSKLTEPNDKKPTNKLCVGLDHHNSLKKFDTFSVEQSYESLASSESIKYTTGAQSRESVGGAQTKSSEGNISRTPEEIPKVIIKRASPSAEFKCELSKVRRDAIIKNKRWQPEVKLQRSWVLDCMAKDLNLDKLRLKVATPDSILKRCSLQKEPELSATRVKNANVNTNENSKKLFRSKSASELTPTHGSIEILAKDDMKQLSERKSTDVPEELMIPKRCKSDLGNMFSKCSENFVCKKKQRYNNHSSTIQLTSKPSFNNADDFANSSNIQCVKEVGTAVTDLETNLNFKEIQSNTEAVYLMRTSGPSQDKTLAEKMNEEKKISTTKINNLIPNDAASDRPRCDSDLDSKILSDSLNATYASKSRYKYYEKSTKVTKMIMNTLKMDGADEVNNSFSYDPAIKCNNKSEVSKDAVIVKDTHVHSVKRHTKSGKKDTKEVRNDDIDKDKIIEIESNETAFMENVSIIDIHEDKSSEICSASASQDGIVPSEINTGVAAKSVICEAPISIKPDSNISSRNSEIYLSDVINMVDNLQTTNRKISEHKLDINDNSDNNMRKGGNNDVLSENSISCINIVEQQNISALDEKVLITSLMNNSKSVDSDTEGVQEPKTNIILNNSADNARESNSLKKVESFGERDTIIEILTASPSQNEVEIQLCPDVIEENGICLYHEDAIPTQFELELEIIDNTVPDPLEVPMPQNDHVIGGEIRGYSGFKLGEDSHQLNRIFNDSGDSVNLDDSRSETMFPEENNSQVSSSTTYQEKVFAYTDRQDMISSADTDEQETSSGMPIENTEGLDSNIQKSSSCADLLVHEVLAAKERLKKCLGKSKNETRLKMKARPKTAAEKKQGLSFDLNTIPSCENNFTKSENNFSTNLIAEANGSKQMDRDFSSANDKEKVHQNQTKTEFKVNKIKSEKRHSKSTKSNLLQERYSSLPPNIQKYVNLTQVERSVIPENSSIDFTDRVEFTKGETTISLKNSKYLVQNHSYSDAKKKMPELINSKDIKCRSKSSRRDINSKYVGKSKNNALPDTVVQESSLDFVHSEEKSVSGAAKHKYKSLRSSSDQNMDSTTEKAKFKLYRIPKITKATHPENGKLTEGLRGSQSIEARMPILKPQVHLQGDPEVSESSSDRESSRSPPVITNQDGGAEYEVTTDSLEYPVPLNKEKEALTRQRTTILDKDVRHPVPFYGKETSVADIVNNIAYHEKATIRHRRYCTLCERWFPTVTRYRRHLSGYQHRHTELTQRRTIHALFTLFTGRPCPRLQPPEEVRIDCEPGELTPLQIAVQGVTKESNKVDRNIKKPTREDKEKF